MSSDDPPPPQRVPDWPEPVTQRLIFPPQQYPSSINDTRQPAVVNVIPLTTPTSGYATTALIAGLGTFVTFGLTGILAVIFGHMATPETETGQRSGHGMAIAGLIFGYLAIGGWVFAIGFLLVGGVIPGLPR